jgi:hypothetical protein
MPVMRLRQTSERLRIESKGPVNGRVRVLEIDLVKADSIGLLAAEQSVLYPCLEGPQGQWWEQEVTVVDLKALKAVHDRLEAPEPAAKAAVDMVVDAPVCQEPANQKEADEAPLPENVAPPACPICKGFTQRMVRGEGFRCCDAGKFNPTRKVWSGCPGVVWDNAKPEAPVAQAQPAVNGNGHVAAKLQQDAIGIESRISNKELSKAGGSATDERKLIGMEATVKTLSGNLYMVVYDLRRGKEEQQKVPDPCYYLWGYGFPWTESVWVFTEAQIQRQGMTSCLERWSKHPDVMEYHVTPVHPGAVETMREIAREKLCKMLREVHESMIKKILSADAALAEANREMDERAAKKGDVSWRERTLAQAKRDNGIRSKIKEVAEDLRNACRLAEQYDDQGVTSDLIQALREAITAESRAFNVGARARNIAPVRVTV